MKNKSKRFIGRSFALIFFFSYRCGSGQYMISIQSKAAAKTEAKEDYLRQYKKLAEKMDHSTGSIDEEGERYGSGI